MSAGNHSGATDDCSDVIEMTRASTRPNSVSCVPQSDTHVTEFVGRVRAPGRLLAALGLTAALAFGAAACGSDSGAAGGGAAASATDGDPTVPSAERGEALARGNGCAGCHGGSFAGGAGPTWIGLAGSEVTLADGSTVVADDVYLTRAIADPGADLVADYNLKMPVNVLSDSEIADIVAYINTLTEG